jgi:hypothetical protein
MNIDQLLDAMAESDPSPGTVLDLVRRKRRAARNRVIYATTSGAAVVVAVVLGVVLNSLTPSPASRSASSGGSYSSPASGQGAAAPLASGAGSRANAPAGKLGPASGLAACTQPALAQLLSKAVSSGASVIVGNAALTGDPVRGGSATYYPVTLSSVRTLAGPTVTSGVVAWIAGASPGATAPATGQLAPSAGSQVFGIVSSPAHSGLPGPVLRAAPVERGEVIVSSGGCLGMVASSATVTEGPASTPGSSPAVRLATREISLAEAEKLAAQA